MKHVFPTHLEPRNLGVGLPTPESSKSDDHSSSPTNSISPAVYITRSQETSEQANDRAPCAGSVAAQPDHMGNEDIPEVNDDPQEELQADSNHPVRSEQEIDSDDNKSQQYNESQDHGTSLYVEDQAIYSDNGSPTDMATYSDYAPSLLAEERTFNQTVTSDSEEDSRKSSSEDTESTLSSSESYGGNGGDGGSGGAGASGSNNDPTFPPQWRGFDGGLSTNQNERRNGGGDMHLHRDAPMPFPMWRLKLPFMMQRYLAQAKRDEQWSLIESGAETWRPKVPPVISVKAASTENGITATGFSTSRRRSRVCKLEK